MDKDSIIRREIIKNIRTYFELDKISINEKYNINFDDYFKKELNSLYEFYKDGLIYDEKNKIITSETGKHFASLIGSNFDTFISGERINSRIEV